MSTYLVSSQQDPRRCGNCGASLVGRFSPCLSCHSVAIEGYGVGGPPGLPAAPPTFPPKRPARQIRQRPLQELSYPYDSIDEAEMVARGNRRARAPMMFAASVLAVSSAVYLGFVIADGSREAAPVAASGNVATSGVDSAGGEASQRSARIGVQGPKEVVATVDSQRSAVPAGKTQARVVAQQPVVVKQQTSAVAQQPVSVQQQPVAASQQLVAAQKPPAVVVAQRPAVVAPPVATAPATPQLLLPAAAPSAQHSVALATLTPPHASTPGRAMSTVTQSGANTSKSLSSAVDQQQTIVVSPNLASLQASTVTPPAVSSSARRPAMSTPQVASRPADAPAVSIADKPHAGTTKAQLQPHVVAQEKPVLAAQPVTHAQPVQQAQATRPAQSAATPAAPLRVALTTATSTRAIAEPPMSAADRQRAESAKYLKAARVNLKANNLSATRSRLAAAIAVDPDNRDALRMRSAVHTLELQRDAILNLARGCGYIGHWACMSHNANIALRIDSSSKEAQRLSNLAMHEAELQIAPSANGVSEQLPDTRYVIAHH